MAGQRQKHPDALAYKRGGRYQALAPVTGWAGATPRLPRGTSPRVRSTWAALWRSPLAGAFKETDVPTLQRWAWWLDQWLRVASEVAAEPLTLAGRSGPVLNPKARYLKQCETALRELERAFGMDALARLRLGITLADNQTKAQALRAPAEPRAM
jgi:P27 family predicted phage terminase small subunit